jgi:hypothetical protein
MKIPVIPFIIDNPQSLRDLSDFRDLALEQIRDCIPQEAAALFDIAKRVPGIFKKHGLKSVDVLLSVVDQRQLIHTKSQLAISRKDCIAPYLDEDLGQLSLYEEFVGKGRVLSELQYAICHGLIVGDAGLKYANPYVNHRPQDWIVGTTPSLYPLNAPLMLPPTQPQPTIGNQTRLTAVDAPVVQPVARAVEEPVLLPEPDEGFDWQPEVVKGGASTPLAPKPPSWDDDADLSNTTRYDWMDDLLSYPSVLIYGAPGAGKSTFAEWLVIKRKDAGHQLEILDPHRAYGQWKGLDVFGDGMDFLSIDDRLKAFADLVESRYLKRSQKPDFNPRPMTVLAEEFTQWAKKCEHSAAFFEMSVSDIRKISMHVIYVSHARTMTALGGSKGLAGTRDSALLELELLAKVDEATGKATPAMRGLLKYPGRAPIEVAIPNLDKPAKSTKPPCATENQLQTLASAGDVDGWRASKRRWKSGWRCKCRGDGGFEGRNSYSNHTGEHDRWMSTEKRRARAYEIGDPSLALGKILFVWLTSTK